MVKGKWAASGYSQAGDAKVGICQQPLSLQSSWLLTGPHPAGVWWAQLAYVDGVNTRIRRLKDRCRRNLPITHVNLGDLEHAGEDKAGSFAKHRNAPNEGYRFYHCEWCWHRHNAGATDAEEAELLLGTGNTLTLLDFRIKNVGPFSERPPHSSPMGPYPALRTQCSPMSGGTFGALVPIISLPRGHTFASSGGHRLRLTEPLSICLP